MTKIDLAKLAMIRNEVIRSSYGDVGNLEQAPATDIDNIICDGILCGNFSAEELAAAGI